MAKYCILITFSTLLLHIVSGQPMPYTVQGKVVESTTQDPLEFANVVLKLLPDSILIRSTNSDETGNFTFKDLTPGHYFIETNLMGFEVKKTSSFEINNAHGFDAGTISLVAANVLLDEIEIAAKNPAFVNAIDRKIYYPENDIQAQSGSASDVLQNIPSITVDAEGEILLRGSANIHFLLNGKPSGLLKNNSSVILDQFPAHTIERIEIITNPSAKYKPDGVAGIINIVTKKNTLTGFYGSILANASIQRRYNGNISLNYNPGKLNISALYGYWQNYNPRTFTDFRTVRESFSVAETTFDLKNAALGKPKSHTATLSLDYHPNEKNSLGISGRYFGLNADRTDEINTLETNATGIIREYSTTRNEGDDEWELEVSAYAERHFDKEDHAISFEAEYASYDELEDSRFSDLYRFPMYPEYKGHNRQNKKGHTTILTADYTNPFNEDMELEAGYEGEYSAGDLDFYSEYFDFNALTWQNDIGKTNRFLYQQDIHAIYATLSKSIESFGILAGLRAEQTTIKSNLVMLDSIIPNNYFNLFPTLHLTIEVGDEELGLSYSRRVNRPDPDELNPFPEYVDIRDIEAGNPYLKPEQIHSIELGYHFRNDHISFLPTLYYRHTYDAFSEETRYINDSILLTTLENLSTEKSGGLELVFSWSPSKKLNLNLNSNLFYHTIDASNLGYEEDKSIISADTKLAAFLNIFSSTKFQLNTSYRSTMLTAQGWSLPVYFLNAGLKQDLFKKKASLTLTVSDVFNTMKWHYIIDTPLLYQKVTRKRKSQIVYLGFSYRFGISPKKASEELIFDDKM